MSGLISVDEALACLAQNRLDLPTQHVPLEDAYGSVLAAPLTARVSRPPAAVSAMDGYAVRLSDVASPGSKLRVTGESPAGQPFSGDINRGEAVRIFTGGEVPQGADHIVIQEDTERHEDEVTCLRGYETSEYIRPAGLDFRESDLLLPPGTRLDAAELAIAAAANHAELPVRRRPRIGLLANGDELKPPGSTLDPGEIVNSNPAGLSALVKAWGGVPVDLGIAGDSEASIRDHIDRAQDIDLFLPVGGASVGDHDHMRSAFANAGFSPVFEKVAVRPGKPSWFSIRGKQAVLGLPGNPASAFVCAHLFAKPLITGTTRLETVMAELASPLTENGNREHFMRATARLTPAGRLMVTPAPNQDSSLIKPFLAANALLRRRPGAPALPAGAPVEMLLIGPLS